MLLSSLRIGIGSCTRRVERRASIQNCVGNGVGQVPTARRERQYNRIDSKRALHHVPIMPAKTGQLQIRVTPRQKTALKRKAAAAGLDVSSYVLARVLPSTDGRITAILNTLIDGVSVSFALAELNDILSACVPMAFADTVSSTVFAPHKIDHLSPLLQNYVAAMVEQAAHQKKIDPPEWVQCIMPLRAPHFATPLLGLRHHLIAASPVPFKRRNLFVDSGVGDRV